MTTEKLNQIKKFFENQRVCAERIMQGDGEYDGADGARTVLELCDMADELFNAIAELE